MTVSQQGAGANPPLPSFWSEEAARQLMDLSRLAGAQIMKIRAEETLDTHAKPDGTPVTTADVAAQDIILAGLQKLTPHIPVISEEKINTPDLTQTGTYWLVDPLDGTRDYVMGGTGFSVNIGLLVDGIPSLGVIYAPAKDDLVYGDAERLWRQQNDTLSTLQHPLACPPDTAPDILTSQREARRLPIRAWQAQGIVHDWTILSGSYKFALLALGHAHLYLRTGITYEWDTAAGDAILRNLGGQIITPDMKPLAYDKPDYLNATFIACADQADTRLMPDLFKLMD